MKKLPAAFTCALIGGIGCAFVLGNVEHPAHLGRNGAALLFWLMVASLVICGLRFFLFLQWRDRRATAKAPKASTEGVSNRVAATGIYALKPGAAYRVLKPFSDCYRNTFAAGEELIFVSHSFLPYHGGHTLFFSTRNIYLQEEENAEILAKWDEYLSAVDSAKGPS